jgi:hypothetical protein
LKIDVKNDSLVLNIAWVQIALQRAYGAIDQLDFLGERNIDGSSPERISIIADYGLHRIGFAEILGWFDALRCRKKGKSPAWHRL